MAQPGAFVPAWKRLGLKLKKFEEAPETNHPQVETQGRSFSAQQHGASQEDSNPGHDQVKLGKRKHHADAADVEGASVKKSKHDWANAPTTGDAVAAPEVELQTTNPTPSRTTPADGAQPKGDPNYRKKKGGDPSYRKKKEKEPKYPQNSHVSVRASAASHAQSLAPPKPTRTPSLSPGRSVPAANGSTLLPSTETGSFAPSSLVTPQRLRCTQTHSSLSPPKSDRRKSVTFTPDTKKSDGNSISNYFKQWVAEQKGSSADFTPAEVAQFSKPSEVHIANSNPRTFLPLKVPTSGKSKKKDPSRYLNYLAQYYQDRGNWKFNKATQNDVLDNSLNIFRIPEEYSDALFEYVSSLQGAGAIERLRERCKKTIEEVDEEISKETMEEREAMKEAALQERLAKERKRRQTDTDVDNITDHEYPEGYVRRLKRSRAEALCRALDIAMPSTTPQNGLRSVQSGTFEGTPVVAESKARSRKRRTTDISSDESSESSSGEEEDSSDDASSSSDEASSDADSATENSDGSGDSSDSEDNSD
ncbi:uncharacterized protein CC84DRAFT_1159073 [Paraphaeosphaeria sporulosa]|uniref:WKF domain-containing protein n=1 Tax=Paraphaeosphaeria sporulosa TaxID=1460663 RepID=A0A177CVM3_9PLEO|nr:uncharacterized protein CC84DRAFT_1159073 [Paraphaeosphaeria sporulosa]OAG11573.1 hypothetical protein CC84DRAFT_1159073 [Paraphaeosphaeria sporulosa]